MKTNTYIYGAGGFSQVVTKELLKQGVNIESIIDKYTDKTELYGLPIVRPTESLDTNAEVLLIISSFLYNEVVNELSKIGFSNFVYLDEVLNKNQSCIKEIVKDMIWYRKEQLFAADKVKLNQVEVLLSNQESIDTLRKVVSFRENPNSDDYIDGDNDVHYFSDSIAWTQKIESFRFVDCGAFTGDTLTSLVEVSKEYGKKIDNVVLFEPEDNNRKKLIQAASQYQDFQYYIYPCGVWKEDAFLFFSSRSSSFAVIDDNTKDADSYQIMCIDIDTALIGAKPNWIKMDIEGAEKEAIIGAKETIKIYSPILTIAIYHQPHDLWEIPLLIHEINPNYDMYIKAHGCFTIETVLYCVPKSARLN